MSLDFVEEILRKFPLEEDFIDHSGCSRRFRISIRKLNAEDFYLEARDLSQREGYYFEVYSSIYSAAALGQSLGKLRGKIRKGISTRYVHTNAAGKIQLTHDEMYGRISGDGIIVDGSALPFRDLERVLTTYEGFEIFIRIRAQPNSE